MTYGISAPKTSGAVRFLERNKRQSSARHWRLDMPFPFFFEEPEQKVVPKSQHGRAGRGSTGARNASSQTDDEMNAAAHKAVRPAHSPNHSLNHSPNQDQSLKASRMTEQGR
jgi:hypothetical protein